MIKAEDRSDSGHEHVWQLATRANASMAPAWDPVANRAMRDLGVDRTTLVMLSFLSAKEPAAMTLDDFSELSPYSAASFFTARLGQACERGHACQHSDGGWTLTGGGRQRIGRLHQEIAGAIASTDPLGPPVSGRLAEFLRRLVDASVATSPPPTARMGWYMHRLMSEADAPLARAVRGIVYLDAYRSDAHQDAWRSCGLSATAAEVLSALWRQGRSLAEVCELLAVREHGSDVYAAAFNELRARRLMSCADTAAVLTTAGTELRTELEATTDRLFFAPWAFLSSKDTAELAGLLSALLGEVETRAPSPPG